MNDQQWFNRVALLSVSVVCLAGVFAVAATRTAASAGVTPTASGSSTDYLYLTIAFNPVTGLDEYFPANFTVPVNTPVLVTVTNYDNGTNLVAPSYSQVSGTLGGYATVWANDSQTGQRYSSVPTTGVAHTFTISQGAEQLNVPIPPAGPTGLPTVVQFSVRFATPGSLTWNCMAPCDGDSMQMLGMMAGTVEVE